MATKKITVTAGTQELAFEVTTSLFNRYTDEVKMDDKVAPSMNLLRRALIDKEQQQSLDELCDQGFAVEMAAMVINEFRPEIELAIKK